MMSFSFSEIEEIPHGFWWRGSPDMHNLFGTLSQTS